MWKEIVKLPPVILRDIQLTSRAALAYCAPSDICGAKYYCSGGASRYNPDGTGGDICPQGSYCPEGSDKPSPCKRNRCKFPEIQAVHSEMNAFLYTHCIKRSQ